jgi:hypothetical protein
MIDVYLSYLYHKELKLTLIEELVNYTQQVNYDNKEGMSVTANLDPQSVSEYVT